MRQLDPHHALKEVRLLRSLAEPDIQELVNVARVRSYQPRERLWIVGDPIPGVIQILSGLIHVSLDNDQGEAFTSTCYWPDAIPTPSLLKSAEWSTTAVAVAPVVWAIFPSEPFFTACARTPQLALRVLNDMCDITYRRIRWERLLRAVPLKQRLLRLFARMADELGTLTEEGIVLDFPLTHQVVADLGWVRRDQAGRTMNELADEGYIIDRHRFRWLIPDRERLGPVPMIDPLVP